MTSQMQTKQCFVIGRQNTDIIVFLQNLRCINGFTIRVISVPLVLLIEPHMFQIRFSSIGNFKEKNGGLRD